MNYQIKPIRYNQRLHPYLISRAANKVKHLSKLMAGRYKLVKNAKVCVWDRVALDIGHFPNLEIDEGKRN